ncbi:MAG TPA: TetR/AcrR family transcriptional regulator [Acidimicrobiales bacterium]|nr:TetR/AcrR family transcriptional regulator [Acidimicrobiales bacterium]
MSSRVGSEDRSTTTRLPALQRRRQLLNVAVESFSTSGFHKTSMSALAAAAGVTKPVLYQHFSSKSELYLEVVRDIGGRLRDDLAKAVADATSAHSQVEAGFRSYFQFFANEPFAFEVLFGDGSRRDPEFAREAHAVEESIAESIAQLIAIDDMPELDRQVLAFGIVGLAEGAGRYWMNHHLELAPSDLAARVAELAWYGLRGRPRRD